MGTESHPPTELKNAVLAVGGQSALSRLLRVSQQSISKWVQKGKPLPAEHVLKVEAETGISRHDLRPDLYPRETSERNAAPVDLEPTR